MERATKRRRLSPTPEGSDREAGGSPSTSSEAASDRGMVENSSLADDSDSDDTVLPPLQDLPTISRIKRNLSRPVHDNSEPEPQASSALPPGIASTLDISATFPSLGVSSWLTRSLKALSITHPTRIQSAAIPQIIAGRDCIGGSRTGSGKTIAFAAPILQKWSEDPSGIYAVILTPTRELALQIYEQVAALGSRQGLKCCLITGGADARTQALDLERRPHVVIATPGRLADHVENSGSETIKGLRRAKFVVLDEADRLLATGKGSMLPDVEICLSALPPRAERQTCLFTATVTPEVRALQSLPRPPGKPPLALCEVDTEDLAIPPTLRQTYQLVNVVHKEKYLHVLLLTPANVEKPTIIFCNRTSTATLLEHLLRLLEHRVTSLHSGLQHADRTNNLARFRARAARILIATDVAARGLDIPDVGLVVNYDLPRNPDDYIHRVGRTARAGRRGTSISLVGQRDVELVQAIEGRVGRQMEVYEEDGVSVEGRVVRTALNVVGQKKREALLAIEEGRGVTGKRSRGMKKVEVAK